MYLPGTSNFTVIKLPLISRTMCLVPTIARRAHFSRSPLSAARVLLREPHSSFSLPPRSFVTTTLYATSLERFLKRLRLIFLSLSLSLSRMGEGEIFFLLIAISSKILAEQTSLTRKLHYFCKYIGEFSYSHLPYMYINARNSPFLSLSLSPMKISRRKGYRVVATTLGARELVDRSGFIN